MQDNGGRHLNVGMLLYHYSEFKNYSGSTLYANFNYLYNVLLFLDFKWFFPIIRGRINDKALSKCFYGLLQW